MIVDNELSLTIDHRENNDEDDHIIEEVMENKHDDDKYYYYHDSKLTGLATYTNSEARARTYASM